MYKISYAGDGSTAEFVFAFPFFQESDVRVALDENILDDSQYGVNASEEFDGGAVVFPAPPAAGARIDIFRQVSLSRIVDYQPAARIEPKNLNEDFNFLLEAFRDLKAVDMDLAEWRNTHENVLSGISYAVGLIEDKLSGGRILGLYNNLLNVLDGALPKLLNDYGSVAEIADNQNGDDYGIL